jgi:5-hmdU DNA kinase, helical domain
MVERRKFQSPLIYWAIERERIRKNKESMLPPPWTEDPILQKYRFCNVRRQDDRVSQWLIGNVLNFAADFDDHMVFLKWVALCRWVNWPPTLGEILVHPGKDKFKDMVTYDHIKLKAIGAFIDKRCAEGEKAWTGAYMVRAPSKRKYPGIAKGSFVAEVVVGAMDKHKHALLEALNSDSAEAMWKVVCAIPNWGSFMAGQFVADLTYTSLLDHAYDLNTWAPQGPGSRRGFNRLLGRDLYAKIEQAEWLDKLQEWRVNIENQGIPHVNLMDTQNCLCEVDKYLRVKAGQGRPRSTYRPETAF